MMALTTRCIILFATATAVLAASAAAMPVTPQQTALQRLAGTWTCVTHGSDNTTFRETDVDTMFANWLSISSTYPAQNGQPGGSGSTYLGYDSKNKRWVITGVGTDGSYFTAYSNSRNYDGSHWVDAYPADGGTAVIHMPASNRYMLDSSLPNAQGKIVVEHAVCTRR
ncbi:MAG: hypothetical protein JOZ01_03175 [Candidatus Eremiobacteraeota bacterium]|nr:hypothetical protein [Candidatus Eremiobacteraeota bacterium]